MKDTIAAVLIATLIPATALADSEKPNTTTVGDAPKETKTVGTVSVPAEAVTKVTNGLPGAAGSIGLTFAAPSFYVRAKIAIAPSPIEVLNASQEEYRTFLLQPDVRGASVAADGAWRTSLSTELPVWLQLGASLKISPELVWAFEDQIADDNGTSKSVRIQQKLSTAALAGFGSLTLDLNGGSLKAVLALEVPLTARVLFGPGLQDGSFLGRALGTRNTIFLGAEPRIFVSLGNIGVFAAFPILAGVGGGTAPGLTGGTVYIGAHVRGDIITWDIGSRQSKQPIPLL